MSTVWEESLVKGVRACGHRSAVDHPAEAADEASTLKERLGLIREHYDLLPRKLDMSCLEENVTNKLQR